MVAGKTNTKCLLHLLQAGSGDPEGTGQLEELKSKWRPADKTQIDT